MLRPIRVRLLVPEVNSLLKSHASPDLVYILVMYKGKIQTLGALL